MPDSTACGERKPPGASEPVTLNKRYVLLDAIGRGGMGEVYAGFDRLEMVPVAVKRMQLPAAATGKRPSQTPAVRVEGASEEATRTVAVSPPGSDRDARISSRLRRALAQEFQVLASLRHPNIITVRDYGFDDAGDPYLVMNLIENAQEVTAAAADRPFEAQLELLTRILRALAYLHRRNILHRDLKPSNVLVSGNDTWLVDFGLSILRSQMSAEGALRGGTAGYVAPELIEGGAPSEASDLFAFGVVAFQVLFGKHPRSSTSTSSRRHAMTHVPEIPAVPGIPPQIAPVLRRLLEPSPADRYANCAEVMNGLNSALGASTPLETAAVRESFLQAAQFVGRDAELKRLSAALMRASRGDGSAWLLAGESGCGKSRLLDELRTRALISGISVIRGRAPSGANPGHSYWPGILRQLLIHVAVDDQEAASLKRLIPDIEKLLDRPVPDPPDSGPGMALDALQGVVLSLTGRFVNPTLIIVEDLHWETEDPVLLRALLSRVPKQPLMVVGSFRDDERPDLPALLPDVTVIKLARFGDEEVRELTRSMVGESGADPGLIRYLSEQTGGNAFFLVEVVRALAEQAGELGRIPRTRLPAHIQTGGIRAVMDARLSRIPAAARRLLEIAALHERRLDLDLLARFAGGRLDELLMQCESAALIEVHEAEWRFVHERVRTTVLELIPADELVRIHRLLAEALESLYRDSPQHLAQIAWHWRVSGDWERERPIAFLAGANAANAGDYALAIAQIQRALELHRRMPPSPQVLAEELDMQIALGPALLGYKGQGSAEAKRCYDRARELVRETGQSDRLGQVLFGLCAFYMFRAEWTTCREMAERLMDVASETASADLRAQAHFVFACVLFWQGNPAPAVQHTVTVREICEKQRQSGKAGCPAISPAVPSLTVQARALWQLGYPERARDCARLGLEEAASGGFPFDMVVALETQAQVSVHCREYTASLEHSLALIEYARDHGFPPYLGTGLALAGWSRVHTGSPEGLDMLKQAIQVLRASGTEFTLTYISSLLAEAQIRLLSYADALETLDTAIERARETTELAYAAALYRLKAEALIGLGVSPLEIDEAYREARRLCQEQCSKSLELRTAISLCRWRGRQGRLGESLPFLQSVCDSMPEGWNTSDMQEARSLLKPIDQAMAGW